MIDWQRNKQLLIDGSEIVVRAFRARHANEEFCAFGYVFELWNISPQFDLCANTRRYFAELMNGYREKRPDTLEDEIRWNSGEYKFPAGLFNMPDELGLEWSTESNRLHQLANQDVDSREVYDGLIAIACEAIAELAKRGLLGDWSGIDFNVAEVGDNSEMVKQRDRQIRSLVMKAKERKP